MEKGFYLEIMTPLKQFFQGQAEAVIMPATDGDYSVHTGHEPVAVAVDPAPSVSAWRASGGRSS